MKVALIVFWLVMALVVSYLAWRKRHQKFYTNTPFLWWLGIYVWGDALVLGPFWVLSAGIWWWLPFKAIAQYLAIFFILRSCIEIAYWLLYQFVPGKHAQAPDLGGVLQDYDPEQRAILYQVTHTCVVALLTALLLITW